jgi:hypothetical protein
MYAPRRERLSALLPVTLVIFTPCIRWLLLISEFDVAFFQIRIRMGALDCLLTASYSIIKSASINP